MASATGLQSLHPYRVARQHQRQPRIDWEWGTLNHECISGHHRLRRLSRRSRTPRVNPSAATRRESSSTSAYKDNKRRVRARAVGERLVCGHEVDPRPQDLRHQRSGPLRSHAARRSRCVSKGHTPLELSPPNSDDRGFFTWDGNYYAINVTEQLDVEKDGGFLRIGLFPTTTRWKKSTGCWQR